MTFNGIIMFYLWQNHLWNIISLALWWIREREEIRISKSVEAGVRFLINWIESELRTPHNTEFALAQYTTECARPFDIQTAWRLVCIYGVKFHLWITRTCAAFNSESSPHLQERKGGRLMMNLLRRFWHAKPYGLWAGTKKDSAKISLCESVHKEKCVSLASFSFVRLTRWNVESKWD